MTHTLFPNPEVRQNLGGREGQECSVLATFKEKESTTLTGYEYPCHGPPPFTVRGSATPPPPPHLRLSATPSTLAPNLPDHQYRTPTRSALGPHSYPEGCQASPRPSGPTHSPSSPPDAPPAAPACRHHPSLPKPSSRKPGSPQPPRSSPTARVPTTWTSQVAAPGRAPARAPTPGGAAETNSHRPGELRARLRRSGRGAPDSVFLTGPALRPLFEPVGPLAPSPAGTPAWPREPPHLPSGRGTSARVPGASLTGAAAAAAAPSPRRVTRPGRTIRPPRGGARGLAERTCAPRSERGLAQPAHPRRPREPGNSELWRGT